MERRHPWLTLLALTVLAGFLRFYQIDKPAIWGDEAATWRRISGSYQQMVDELRVAGFMPANYLLTWYIKEGLPVGFEYRLHRWWQRADGTRYWGTAEADAKPSSPGRDDVPQFVRRRELASPSAPREELVVTRRLIEGGLNPTPLVMRFLPALCGTLMVPAMYFLASQLVQRRTALLVALFTCCSAYLLNYSRDAKMYMQVWFFATLHVGCLLWWLRAYARQPKVANRVSAKHQELAEGVAGVLPAHHVGDVARAFVVDAPLDNSAAPVSRLSTLLRWACWLVTGLAMISFHATGLAILAIELLVFLATIPQRLHWVRLPFTVRPAASSRPAMKRSAWSRMHVPPVFGFVAGVLAIVMLFNSYRAFSRFYERVEPDAGQAVQFEVNEAGLGWIESYNSRRTAAGHFLQNATAFLFSWEWVKPTQKEDVDPVALHRLRTAAIVLLIAIAVGLLPWRRLLDRISGNPRVYDRGPMPLTSLFLIAAWLIVPVYGVYCLSGAWSEDGLRVNAALPNATIVSAVFPNAANGDVGQLQGALTRELKPVLENVRPFADARATLAQLPWNQLFVVRGIDLFAARWWAVGLMLAAVALVVLSWPSPRAIEPVALAPGDLASDDRLVRKLDGHRRRRARWLGSLVGHGLGVILIATALWTLLVLFFVTVPPQEQSVWMPRYVGFVWPAFAIAACTLIMRLPLAPLRWLVVAALLGVNLTNVWARREYGEPPTPAITQDQIITQHQSAARFFVATLTRTGIGEPGSGFVGSIPNAYYLSLFSGAPATPRTAFFFVDRLVASTRLGNNFARVLPATLMRDRKIDALFLWTAYRNDQPPEFISQQLDPAMPPNWQRTSEPQRWQVYDHWTWRKFYRVERQHWIKTTPSTTPTGGRQSPAAGLTRVDTTDGVISP
jgi:hypothetical protein